MSPQRAGFLNVQVRKNVHRTKVTVLLPLHVAVIQVEVTGVLLVHPLVEEALRARVEAVAVGEDNAFRAMNLGI